MITNSNLTYLYPTNRVFSSALYGWKKPSAHIVLKLTPESIRWNAFWWLLHYDPKGKTQHDWLHYVLLHSWPFSRYSAPIYWLVHGHVKSNNETVFRQTPRVGNIAKSIVHYYPRNVDRCSTWSEVAWRCRWNLSGFFKICICFVLLHNKSVTDSNLNVSIDFFLGNIDTLCKQNSLFPSRPVSREF